jgi:hypothetical protein
MDTAGNEILRRSVENVNVDDCILRGPPAWYLLATSGYKADQSGTQVGRPGTSRS